MLNLKFPVVMGILNLSPDSFYDGGKYTKVDDQLKKVDQMLKDGAGIIDMGAVSSRPGAEEIPPHEELKRILPSLKLIRHHFPKVLISVDTFRKETARAVVENGANLINDIYGGRYEEGMLETIASLKVPYIIMHMKGNPRNMQNKPEYSDVIAEIAYFFEQQTNLAWEAGIREIIVDPGFGFGKTPQHNFMLLSRLSAFRSLGYPILVGLSRKSMITRTLNIPASEAMNATTVMNTIALLNGADLLRVHDVKEAMQTVRLLNYLEESHQES